MPGRISPPFLAILPVPFQEVDDVPEALRLADSLAKVAEGTAWRSENPDRKTRRVERLRGTSPVDIGDLEGDDALERVLDEPDFQPVHWLSSALRVTRCVALVRESAGDGTGFLIAPWLFMTNNHVLPDPEAAAAATVRFGYQEQVSGDIVGVTSISFDPDRCFVTSPW